MRNLQQSATFVVGSPVEAKPEVVGELASRKKMQCLWWAIYIKVLPCRWDEEKSCRGTYLAGKWYFWGGIGKKVLDVPGASHRPQE